jgi:hypothetical protein
MKVMLTCLIMGLVKSYLGRNNLREARNYLNTTRYFLCGIADGINEYTELAFFTAGVFLPRARKHLDKAKRRGYANRELESDYEYLTLRLTNRIMQKP